MHSKSSPSWKGLCTMRAVKNGVSLVMDNLKQSQPILLIYCPSSLSHCGYSLIIYRFIGETTENGEQH